MKITIKKLTDWDLVLEMAMYTQGKYPKNQFPSSNWKRKTVKAQHSILRCLQFVIYIEDVPNYTHNHFVRHVHSQPFIASMRPDITGLASNDEITRNTPNNGCYMMSAQEFLNISYQRLCYKASKETREIWEAVVEEMRKIEPELVEFAVPNCVRLNMCPEYKSCGFMEGKKYLEEVERIRK